MAKRTQHTIGLDIGTSRVTCIAGETGEGGLLNIVGIGEAEARGLRKGVIVNPDAAVDAIKKAVTTAPVLVHPDLNQPFTVEADASAVGYGAIISQEREGKLHPIAFISRSFNPAQRNYPTYDRELHAIVEAFKEWRQYLIQSPHPVTVLTDHQALQYFRTAHNLQRRQTRYAVELGEFNIHLKHRPGRLSGKPDALSRRPDFGDGKEDNKEEVLLPNEMFIEQLEELEIKEVNPCFFCFDAKWLWANLSRIDNNNKQKEYYLTDLVRIAIQSGAPIASMPVDPRESIGVNTPEQLEMAEKLA